MVNGEFAPMEQMLDFPCYIQIHSISKASKSLSWSKWLNTHSDASSGARGLIFALSLPLLPYLLYASSEGSEETAHMRRLV